MQNTHYYYLYSSITWYNNVPPVKPGRDIKMTIISPFVKNFWILNFPYELIHVLILSWYPWLCTDLGCDLEMNWWIWKVVRFCDISRIWDHDFFWSVTVIGMKFFIILFSEKSHQFIYVIQRRGRGKVNTNFTSHPHLYAWIIDSQHCR